jgi:hypothetical protein
MILKFADLPTLRLALVSGVVPPTVAAAPAVADFSEAEQIWVETKVRLTQAAQAELRKLGVQTERSGAVSGARVSCWAELLPLSADAAPPAQPEQTPVLFELSRGEELARLALEILRLGNDRQGFRWLEDADGGGHALLRVVGPPYYSLLRALDRRTPIAPIAYLERAPRVWIEIGHTHPLVDHLKPPEGKLVLLRPPRQWTMLDDAPFRDIYEATEFRLPTGPAAWTPGELDAQVRVAPTLQKAGGADAAELWVLRGDGVAELNRFVQNADDQLLGRLAFAVGRRDDRTVVVLRVRQARAAPPVLVLNAESYRHYLKLPNLFLPAGTRLHPPLRRDVVRRLLADDPARVVWLAPVEGDAFTPQSLPEDAFRPLTDWVDYVLDREQEALHAWVQAARFDFEPFICADDEPSKPRKPPTERGHSKGGPRGDGETTGGPVGAAEDRPATTALPMEEIEDLFDAAPVAPNAMQERLLSLEERFAALEGGLDAPERVALWPELAGLNAALRRGEESGVCWMHALWHQESAPAAWARRWFAVETESATDWNGAALDRLLALPEPIVVDLRRLASYLVWAARREPAPAELLERLNPVQRFLERHERLLPVRAVWLAWLHLAELAGGDVLALARARDRLLERLFQNGLRPEQDLPLFLRAAGQTGGQRIRGLGPWMNDLVERARAWIEKPANQGKWQVEGAKTASYIDLLFAFGLARLGETDSSRALVERAGRALAGSDASHAFLLEAFTYRIRAVWEGRPIGGTLPAALLERVEAVRKARLINETDHAHIVDRLRAASRILEPHQQLQAYRQSFAKRSDLDRAIAEMPDIHDRAQLAERIHALLRNAAGQKAVEPTMRLNIYRLALEHAPRIGEDFAKTMLDPMREAYDALPDGKDAAQRVDQLKVLEKALFLAAHFDRVEHIHPLLTRFQKLLQTDGAALAVEGFEPLVGQCFRGLRKMGMRTEIETLLGQLAEVLLQGGEAANLITPEAVRDTTRLRALLHVAGGWYYSGRMEPAERIVAAVRSALYQKSLFPPEHPQEKMRLACAYASAMGHAPPEVAQKRIEELFDRLEGVWDNHLTKSHYSTFQLRVVEAVVLALVSDDFTLGANARRWLDDDEFLVRRRIHRDLRQRMEKM